MKKQYIAPTTGPVLVNGEPLCVTYGQMYMCSPGGYYYGGDFGGDIEDSRQ